MFVKRLARARMFDFAIQSLISQQRSVSARKGFSFVNRVGIHRRMSLSFASLLGLNKWKNLLVSKKKLLFCAGGQAKHFLDYQLNVDIGK